MNEVSRDRWGSKVEFVLTCVGCAVGLGNVWRFPYLVYRNGGGAFLIPYFLSLFFLGIPLFGLDICIGQFASLGPLRIWRMNPLFKGLGMAMVIVTSFIMIYYSVVIATFLHYLFFSLTDDLPWSDCLREWNTCTCRSGLNDTSYLSNTYLNCSEEDIGNSSTSPSEEYYNNHVLRKSSGLGEAGDIQWQLLLANLLSWTITCIILIKGVKSLGKAIYVFTILPYILLTVLLVRGLTLDGHQKGIDYYLDAHVDKLTDASVWGDAAVQIFFSTSTCSGAMIAMASYNKFDNHTLRDALLIPIINCLTSFFAGFAIFAILGFMAENKGVDVTAVTSQGPGLVFVVYPEALSRMPVAPLWSILFFIMLFCLGSSSMTSGVESVLTAIQDQFPVLTRRKYNIAFRIAVCIVGFLLGIPQVDQGGIYLLNLMDTFVGGFPLLIIGFFELMAVIFVYGVRRLQEDIMMMLGTGRMTRIILYYFITCWVVISPCLLVAVIVFRSIQYEPISNSGYPDWAEWLGWLIVACPLSCIPGWYLGYYCYQGGFKVLVDMNEPLETWGPYLKENRTGRYALTSSDPVEKPYDVPQVPFEKNPVYHNSAFVGEDIQTQF